MKPSLLWTMILPLATAAAAADDAGLRRCRALPEAAARLACYDALPMAPAVAPAPAAPAALPALAAPSIATFGLEQRRDEPDEVRSSIPGRFEGWGPRSRFRLANGQVWQVSDDSSAAYELADPKVTVRRAAMGSFMLEIEGARRAPRVRRIE